MRILKNRIKNLASRGARLFTAVLLLATFAPQILNTKPVFAGDNYPWDDAATVNQSTYDWGYYPDCPTNDPNCKLLTGVLNGHTYGEADPWVYNLRNCTSYVAWKIKQMFNVSINGWGDAKDWDANATGPGHPYTNDTTPREGDIAQWTTGGGGHGHVAYVGHVDSNGVATFYEYNYAGTGAFTNTYTSATRTPTHYIHIGTLSSGGGTNTPAATSTSSLVLNGVEHVFVGDSIGYIRDISWGNGSQLGEWTPYATSMGAPITKMTSFASNGVITVLFATGKNLYSLTWGNGVSPNVASETSFTSNILGLSSAITADGATHAYVGEGSNVWNVSWGNGTPFNKTLLTAEGAVVNALSNQITPDGYQNVYVGLNNGAIMHIYWTSDPTQAQQWNPGSIGSNVPVVDITSQLVNGVTNIDATSATAVTNFVYGNGHAFGQNQVGYVTGTTIKAIGTGLTLDGYQHAIATTGTGNIVDISWTDPAYTTTYQLPVALNGAPVGLSTLVLNGVLQANGITASEADNVSWGNGVSPNVQVVSAYI